MIGVQHVTEAVHAGNIYVNRNQIGAIVGSQPFGGEGFSGTGPKAGGPHYLSRFSAHPVAQTDAAWPTEMTSNEAQVALNAAQDGDTPTSPALVLPGPTGESNRLTLHARTPLLCLGPGEDAAKAQAEAVMALGGRAATATGALPADILTTLSNFAGALWWGDTTTAQAYTVALSKRNGPILPLITGQPDLGHVLGERHVCVDTTAAGGNAALLGGMD